MRGRMLLLSLLTTAIAGCGGTVSREYTSPEGRFRVHFPGKPKLTEQPPIMSPVGPIVEKTASTEDWSRTARLVSYADYPGGLIHLGNRDSLLDVACQGWATEKQLVILSKMSIWLNGHPGREMNFETGPSNPLGKITGRARFYMVGARLYQVCIAGPPGKNSPESMDGFLNSFALLDHGTPQPTVMAGVPLPQGPPPPVAPQAVTHLPMGFYAIPDPAFEPIVSAAAPSGPGGDDQSADPGERSSGQAPHGEARIREFRWNGEDTTDVTASGNAERSDGALDHRFRLSLELPPNTIVEGLVITGGDSRRWVTRPGSRDGPVAIYQNGRPVARGYVAQVGLFAGPQDFDLSIRSDTGDGRGESFEVQVELSVAGNQITLKADCRRPDRPPGAVAKAQSLRRKPEGPSSLEAPASIPKTSASTSTGRPAGNGR
jgi:hypothetical protein